jgi:NTE family protein
MARDPLHSAASAGPTAFVLAGGGSLGAAQAGMLAELAAEGIRPDFVVGVSAGAINGAFYAHEPGPATVTRMSTLWSGFTTRRALGLSWRSLLGVIGLRDHVASPRGLRGLLQSELRYSAFHETAIPLHVVCAELLTGVEVVLSSGSVIDAILASTAIPGVYPPVAYQGRQLVDGAIADNTPIATACRLGARRLIVLPAGFACGVKEVGRNALARAMHAITLLGAGQLKQDFLHYSAQARIHVVPPLCPIQHSAYDYSHGADLISRARESTRTWIEGGGLERSEFPAPLVPHSH